MKRRWVAGIFFLVALAAAQEPASPCLPRLGSTKPFTFVVLGDNRGDDSGKQPAAFGQILAAVNREKPALILDSGDMIYGHSSDETAIREQWRIYRNTVQSVRAPIFHAPGNHDLWDAASANLYHELWGATHYAFSYGNTRFIALDTETVVGQIGGEQFQWLEQELRHCAQPNIFLFLHRPLFPVDGGIGSSLDEYPADRDRLHRLFMEHRDRIRGVFAGHEHLFNYQERDGIRYYISGGGGAPLYTAPELGGFYHFLTVRVAGSKADVQLHKMGAPTSRPLKPRAVQPGEVLENWEQGLFWYAWDHSANLELTSRRASHGTRGLCLNFDLRQYGWPVLVLPFGSPRNLSDSKAISLDVYLPHELRDSFTMAMAAQGIEKHQGPPIKLRPGWNTVSTELNDAWLPAAERASVQGLEWSLSAQKEQARGYILFDNLRIQRVNSDRGATPELLESWERPLLWRVFDESVRAEVSPRPQAGLILHMDWSSCNRPILFAQLNPPWDLTRTKALILRTQASDSLPQDLTLDLVLRAKDIEFDAPAAPLKKGANELTFALDGGWLPAESRSAVQQVGFRLVTTNTTGRADIVLTQLRAAERL